MIYFSSLFQKFLLVVIENTVSVGIEIAHKEVNVADGNVVYTVISIKNIFRSILMGNRFILKRSSQNIHFECVIKDLVVT